MILLLFSDSFTSGITLLRFLQPKRTTGDTDYGRHPTPGVALGRSRLFNLERGPILPLQTNDSGGAPLNGDDEVATRLPVRLRIRNFPNPGANCQVGAKLPGPSGVQ